MTKMELIKEYVKSYIKDNNVTGEDIQRLYNEAWEVCKDSVSYSKSVWLAYMKG